MSEQNNTSIFHTINPKHVWAGDHIYIWSSPIHQHHGIVLFVDKTDFDQSQVLEFNTPDGSLKIERAQIQVVSLKQFRKDKKLKRVIYGSKYHKFKIAGTAYGFQSLPPEHVVDNAHLILEQIQFEGYIPETRFDGHYDLILKNCECLAYWCKTGMWYSSQIEQVVHWIGKPLLSFIKGIIDIAVANSIIQPLKQEALSEIVESSLCLFNNKFCSTLFAEGIGNAIAVVIIEVFKLYFRAKQYNNGQMSKEEYWTKTLTSIITAVSIGACSFIIQALLTYFTFGCATAYPWIGGFVGSLIGSLVGDILGKLLVDGIQLTHKMLSD
ncbi:unnamed protein product [Didymodactylos carnosus]|nr:unnamed protein product [Didymodactylos carnosus]CAF4480791.1 unnamed protein product [Didymodactylos carnosus]